MFPCRLDLTFSILRPGRMVEERVSVHGACGTRLQIIATARARADYCPSCRTDVSYREQRNRPRWETGPRKFHAASHLVYGTIGA